MNCQEARNLFEEAIDHALAGARKRKFDLHLQRCSSCRALYDTEVREHTELFRAFKDFSAEALPSHSQMVARLVAAHRPATRLPWYRRMPRWMKFAAALVLCVGTVALARQITDLVVERNAFKDNEETEISGKGNSMSSLTLEEAKTVPMQIGPGSNWKQTLRTGVATVAMMTSATLTNQVKAADVERETHLIEDSASVKSVSCMAASAASEIATPGDLVFADARYVINVGTVYTNSVSAIEAGSTIVVPDGAAFDLRTISNSDWCNYKYSLDIAGCGPDGLGALRDTGTVDPRHDDVIIPSITLSGDALIKSDRYMALLDSGYADTTLMLNGHTLTLDFAEGQYFSIYRGGPWSSTGVIKLIRGGILVPTITGRWGYSDFENATIEIEGPHSIFNIDGTQAGVYVKNFLMSNSAKLVGNGFVGVNKGTFRPSEKTSDFSGRLRIWGDIVIDLSELDGPWTFFSHDFYQVSSAMVTLKPASWAIAGSVGHKIVHWVNRPAAITFQLDASVPANWQIVERADGLYLYPTDCVVYARRDLESASWRFYKYDWTDVTDTCGLSEPTKDLAVCFGSVAEYEALKQLTFDAFEVVMLSCVLDENATLTEMPFIIDSGAVIDVAGHMLSILASSAESSPWGTVTSSVGGGILALDVPEGQTNVVTSVLLTGGANLQLWKTGTGRLSMERKDQSFGANGTISCVVKAGVLARRTGAGKYWGESYSMVWVDAGAQVDIMGGWWWDYDYCIAGNGPDGKGALVSGIYNPGCYIQSTDYAHLRSLVLADDAAIGGDNIWALNFYNNESHPVIFNGHTLTVGEDNFVYWVALNPADSGKVVVGSVEVYQGSVDFSNVDVEVKKCLASNSGSYFNPVRSLAFAPTATYYVSGTPPEKWAVVVHETYRPSLNVMPPVILGAEGHFKPVLDLSSQTNALDGAKLFFAEGTTVVVDVGNRKLESDEKLIDWPIKPADNVSFLLRPGTRRFCHLAPREDGLYLYTGLVVLVR